MKTFLRLAATITLFITILGASFTQQTLAQDQSPTPTPTGTIIPSLELGVPENWSAPINLSRSGAASQPRIVTGPEGVMQAFWLDQFDGLMTSFFDGETWSEPIQMLDNFRRPLKLKEMPYLSADSLGNIHALWYEDDELSYNQIPIGDTAWPTRRFVAESALVFDLDLTNPEEIYQAYIRTLHDSRDGFAGIYTKNKSSRVPNWSSPEVVYTSIYFRILTEERARLSQANTGRFTEEDEAILYLAWDDPRLEQTYFSYSIDSGETWSAPELFGAPDDRTSNPRLAALENSQDLIRIWQANDIEGCALFQQSLEPATEVLTTTDFITPTWGIPLPILEDLEICPSGENFWPIQDGNGLLWIWGQGTNNLSLANWTPEQIAWTQLSDLSFSFEDTETQRPVFLGDLHASPIGAQLAVVGIDDEAGEIWVTVGQSGLIESEEEIDEDAIPSLWTAPEYISPIGADAVDADLTGPPTMVMDDTWTHTVWSQASPSGSPALFYTRHDSAADLTGNPQTASRSVSIFQDSEGIALRHPALILDESGSDGGEDILHLVWSGGAKGNIRYSRATTQQASSPDGWLPPVKLSQELAASSAAAWPQIGMDSLGRLYVTYILPLNEGRGVYLVYSDDGGRTWSLPEKIFDAKQAEWQMVDHPTLAVTPDGNLHAAWVQGALTGGSASQGIFYTRSMDRGQSWSEAVQMTEAGHNWPRLALSGGQLHLIYARNADNSLRQRWVALEQQTDPLIGWSAESRIPDMQDIGKPFGLTVDGGAYASGETDSTLHLVGVDEATGTILYNGWDGERWGSAERFYPQAHTTADLFIEPQADPLSSAATRLQGGNLAVTWLGTSVEGLEEDIARFPALFYTTRIIPTKDISSEFVPETTPTPLPSPTPELEPTMVLSPTPPINIQPLASESPIPPLALGGGLAAVIVVLIFAGILLRGRNRR